MERKFLKHFMLFYFPLFEGFSGAALDHYGVWAIFRSCQMAAAGDDEQSVLLDHL